MIRDFAGTRKDLEVVVEDVVLSDSGISFGDVCVGLGKSCTVCIDDSQCNDGDDCNVVEYCAANGFCSTGQQPLECRNVAQGKQAVQSTTYYRETWDGEAWGAVDGNRNQNLGSITHTESETEPWWEVDLGQGYRIESVHIYNRVDCYLDRLAGALVSLWDETGSLVVERDIGVLQSFIALGFSSGGAHVASKIRARLPPDGSGVLSLAQVEVNVDIPNLARGRATSQLTTGYGGTPDKAVDGNTDGNWGDDSGYVTHTDLELSPWWEVLLDETTQVQFINIYNRVDCCSDRLEGAKISLLSHDDTTVVTRSIGTLQQKMTLDFSDNRNLASKVRVWIPDG